MALPSLSSYFLFFAFIFVTHAFDLSIIQMEAETCPYTVVVMTSCLSPKSTRDQISLTFGDADGNKVKTPKLGGSVRGPADLGQCSTDTFQVKGQCLVNPICSLYISQSGLDGWVPESIEIYSEGSKSVKFDFSKSGGALLNAMYGQNNCNATTVPPSPPAIPPPSPTKPRPSVASGLGESVFLAFAAIAIAFAVIVR
ncbi:unnamed protein product [Cochlearia groenlandica]